MSRKPENAIPTKQQLTLVEQIFDDPESKRNLVGLFDLALKVHMRKHPELYRRGAAAKIYG